jgi:DNA-binding CsgD family transcriptional regulator
MIMLERDAVLAELDGLVPRRSTDRGAMVLIGGEAGVGKTSLVELVCTRAHAPTAFGACDPLTTPRPLGPVFDLAYELGILGLDTTRGEAREELFTGLLEALRGRNATVVVVEDVHWADEATFDFLRFLGRRIGTTRALVLVTFRTDEVGGQTPVTLLMGDLATAAHVRRIRLWPLSIEGVAELAGVPVDDAAPLHQLTGGNPFFVTAVLAAGSRSVPETVRDAVLARVARLSPAALAALRGASVIPQRAEVRVVERIADGPGGIEECIAAGLLRRDGDAVSFRHELVREALDDSVPPRLRQGLHRAVLDALRSGSSNERNFARLAYHAEAANDRASVLEYAPRAAAEAARLGAHREAAAQYMRAVRFADQCGPADLADLLDRASYESYFTGEMAQALALRQRSLECWRVLDDELQVGVALSWISRLAWFTGDGELAVRSLDEAIVVLERLPPGSELARAYSQRSGLRMVAQDVESAVMWGERAVAVSEQVGDVDTLSQGLNNLGSALLAAGRDTGRTLLKRSLDLARENGFRDHTARAWINLACTDVRAREYPLALEELEEGISYCTDLDLGPQRLFMVAWRAQARLDLGRWDDAADDADEVLAHPSVLAITRVTALTVIGRLRARRGDPDPWSPLNEAQSLARGPAELRRLVPLSAARAEAAWLAGDTNRAVIETALAWKLAQAHGTAWDRSELAFWRWRGGAPPRLESTAPTRPFDLQMSGQHQAAAAAWERRGCCYERAAALADSTVEADVLNALAEFEALGARPAAAIVRGRLRQVGAVSIPRGPRAETRQNPGGLTARQIDVLTLLADGLSNAEIASALVVSEKTVENHVSAILKKLGVRNRSDAGYEAVRFGLRART